MKLSDLWAKIEPYVESYEALMTTLSVFGLTRHSERRGGLVLDEKKVPDLAIGSWHRNRYVELTTRKTGASGDSTLDVTPHERMILTDWMQEPTLMEIQQNHFKVSIANLSWAKDDDPQKDVKFQNAVNYLKALAALPTHDERTAMADGDDYIKDPPEEYWQYQAQQIAGRRFADAKDLLRYAKVNARLGNRQIKRHLHGTPASPGGLMQKLKDELADENAKLTAQRKKWF